MIGSSIQISTPESPTYTAGVVEYLVNQGVQAATSAELFKLNADKYIEIMNSTEAANVDIIVFPESCLNTRLQAVIVPTEHEDIDLCTNDTYDQNLRNIACAAKNLKKYVVINLTMKRNCTEVHEAEHQHDHEHDHEDECPNEWLLYNTNVVINRAGKVVSLYRKYNLFGESGITKPTTVDMSTFTTDFGVTFGHFICFDLMFQEPALDLVAKGIKDFVFPTMWFSELPFLTAVQIQQNWAHSNDANFLGAGANNPQVGSAGSGIYSGKSGALISTMTGDQTTRLLVHEVPKVPGGSVTRTSPAYSGENFDGLKLKRDQLDVYTFQDLKVPDSTNTSLNESFTLCHSPEEASHNLCCDFEISTAWRSVPQNSVSYKYKAAVFMGNRTFDGVADGNMTACAILACKDSSIASCGIRYLANETTVESEFTFEKIVIKGNFPKVNVFTLPNSLNFNVSPYPTSDFTYVEETNARSSNKEITMSLLTSKTDLFTFAIYGRDFRSSGNKIASTIVMILTAFVFKLFM